MLLCSRPLGSKKRMIVEKRRIEDLTLLRLEGVIKLGESAEFFAQTLDRALSDEAGHVLVDFSRINYIDSTGIGELVGYLGRFRDLQRKLTRIGRTALEWSDPHAAFRGVDCADRRQPFGRKQDVVVFGDGGKGSVGRVPVVIGPVLGLGSADRTATSSVPAGEGSRLHRFPGSRLRAAATLGAAATPYARTATLTVFGAPDVAPALSVTMTSNDAFADPEPSWAK